MTKKKRRKSRSRSRSKGTLGWLIAPFTAFIKLSVWPFKALGKASVRVGNPLWWVGMDAKTRARARLRTLREIRWRQRQLEK